MIPAGYEIVEGLVVADIKPLPKHVLVRWLKKTETKGGVLIPQFRQRSGFMKGQILAVGPKCDPKLQPGVLIEFNGLSDKAWVGQQDPADRDTVFFTRVENVFALVKYDGMDHEDAVAHVKDGKPPQSAVDIAGIMGVQVTGRPILDMVGSWLLVRPDEMPERTASGLAIPKHIRDRQRRQQKGLLGEVLSAGGDVDSCEKGDRVAFDATHATPIHLGDHNDEVALVIDRDDVIGLEEPAAKAA